MLYAEDTEVVGTGGPDSPGAMVNRDTFMHMLTNTHFLTFFVKLQSMTKTCIQ